EVVGGGVDQVAGAVDLRGQRLGALGGGLELLVARLAAEDRGLAERRRPGVVLLALAVLAVAVGAVRGEGVRAQQRALAHRGDRLGVLDRQRETGLLAAGQRTGGTARGAPQRLVGVAVALRRGLAQADRQHDRRLETVGGGQLGH